MVKNDLNTLGINDGCWYDLAQDRGNRRDTWYQCMDEGRLSTMMKSVVYLTCGKTFR